MRRAQHSRDEILGKLLLLFRERGVVATTLSEISATTGLGRATLYHHFPGGKQEIVASLMDYVSEWFGRNLLPALGKETPPEARLREVARIMDRYFDGGRMACLFSVLILDGTSQPFAARIRRSLENLVGVIAGVALEAGLPQRAAHRNAQHVVSRLHGAAIIARGLGDPEPFRRALRELPADALRR